ncbi:MULTISPECIES: carboxylesterase/lipase family protein [unclassified Sphingobium]|uniref:carboxylesterase/lipase family protein n=1 Tax=unclassified Sphingobium TaxID=2611147 RepID=UPI000D15A83C|nr:MULTISPECIES: carboxylesterase family protein [unclassified Sphingobium]MBG6120216.1 para-nitrobenzyl esterase [Sphingobium sp. JAI105]PSO09971.1 carboxylesterase [Sphingobium sp. AEW4]TWD00128.1 para-nitrobenzyl esterase [Sphingobium sp. AEW010]TWD19237.1 para-nitrobenzyl esterase [Sphingobium sp. AEW013]TWD22098.1 para-nitrobenzyl esterase [Sphingobium sp. AEW001]
MIGRMAIAAATGAVFVTPVFAKPATEVRIESGTVAGAVEDGILSFKGIPYAAPPLGPLRWRAPQPAPKWSGIRASTTFGHDCMQKPFPSDAAPLGTGPAEDCLVLNVWHPANTKARNLPVMVWIYGGGFVNGGSSSAIYDGSQFARKDVILVSFNYRLGRFGFFAHPALTKAKPAGEPLGNYAYMDQIAALKWVQRNIAAFGGNPRNVTVFGESAGGASVLSLLTSPAARGLFQKAIVQSGYGPSPQNPMRKIAEGEPGVPTGHSIGFAFAKANGIEGDGPDALAALRALPAEKLVDGLNMASLGSAAAATYVGGPLQDGAIVVESPYAAYLAGRVAKVPVMTGATSADIGFVTARTMDDVFAPFGPRATEARKVYDPDGAGNFRTVASRAAMDATMIEPARFTAKTFAGRSMPAYEFRFSYVAESKREAWPLGAPHASELPYVFDTLKAKYGEALTERDAATARATNTYWANFAKNGDPNRPDLPKWPRYDVARDLILNFSPSGPQAIADPLKARLDLTETAAEPFRRSQ